MMMDCIDCAWWTRSPAVAEMPASLMRREMGAFCTFLLIRRMLSSTRDPCAAAKSSAWRWGSGAARREPEAFSSHGARACWSVYCTAAESGRKLDDLRPCCGGISEEICPLETALCTARSQVVYFRRRIRYGIYRAVDMTCPAHCARAALA